MEQDSTISENHLSFAIIRKIFDYFVMDLTRVSREALKCAGLKSSTDVRLYPTSIIAFSKSAMEDLEIIRNFLWENMYQNERVLKVKDSPEKIIRGVFDYYMAMPEDLPDTWKQKIKAMHDQKVRIIGDYISGMTEKFVIEIYRDKAITTFD